MPLASATFYHLFLVAVIWSKSSRVCFLNSTVLDLRGFIPLLFSAWWCNAGDSTVSSEKWQDSLVELSKVSSSSYSSLQSWQEIALLLEWVVEGSERLSSVGCLKRIWVSRYCFLENTSWQKLHLTYFATRFTRFDNVAVISKSYPPFSSTSFLKDSLTYS